MDHHPTESPPRPRIGAYYWVPIPPIPSPGWRVLTCHDLGFDEDKGHLEIWPAVITHLAAIWGRGPKAMMGRLVAHCYGLPRGRVTRPKTVYLLLHGADSPIPDWTRPVADAFGLHDRRVKPLFDERERRMSGDVRALARVLDSFLSLTDTKLTQRELHFRRGRFPGTP